MDWEACRLPDELNYVRWVNYVFDHPVLDPAWWWQESDSGLFVWWNESADHSRTLRYLTRLFREPQELIGRFTRAQIDQGLGFIVNNSCSDHMFVLRDTQLSWPKRRECFEAMINLYEHLMAPIYENDLGHLQIGRGDPLRPNYACYMCWDIIPLYGGLDHPEIDQLNDAVLDVFQQVLTLKAESCLESVLHGLGHWQLWIPKRTEPIVRKFLERKDISPELRTYAKLAAVGRVI